MKHLSERARKMVREVGIIVLGVVIALLFGEIATAVRNRIEAQTALAAVRDDMSDNAPSFELTPLILDCNERRLKALASILSHARRTGRIPDVGDIPARLSSTFRTGSWDRAVANGNVLYLDPQTVATLTDYHDALSTFRQEWDDMASNWARLGVLTHAAGSIDESTLAMAGQAVAELRFQSRNVRMIAALLLQAHESLDIPISYGTYNNIPMSRAKRFGLVRSGPICKPLEVDGQVFVPTVAPDERLTTSR